MGTPKKLEISENHMTRRNGKKRKPESTRSFKVIVEKHSDGYVAYPLGLKGVVVAEGNTYEEAIADVKSAIRSHIQTFGADVLDTESVLEAFVAETEVAS
jgi:predicted RNase H-like HicB family nuclease